MQFKVVLPPGCSWTCCGSIVGTGGRGGSSGFSGVGLGEGEVEGEGDVGGCGVGGGGNGGIARERKTYGYIPACMVSHT